MSQTPAGSRSAIARAELQETLDAIEDKLNVPKRLGELGTSARESWDRNPIPWLIGAAIAAVAVSGIIVWAALSDD